MQMHQQSQFAPRPPRHEQRTIWYNPLDVEQKALVYYGDGPRNEPRPTQLTFQPKAETEVSSRFDAALQVVHCAHDSCRQKAPGHCTNPAHEGNVVGGLCPQLRRKGSVAKLLPSLDPAQAELEQANATIAAQQIALKAAENTTLLAAARAKELEDELERRTAPDGKPAEAKAPQAKK